MKKRYFLTLLLCMLAVTGMMAQKTGGSVLSPKGKITRLRSQNKPVLRSAQAVNEDVALFEDFHLFTKGSEASPNNVDITDEDTGEIPASYTADEGWSGWGVYQAGGVAYIGMANFSDYFPEEEDAPGYIATPFFDASSVPDGYTIKFKARSILASGQDIEVYWNFDYGQDYDGELVSITNEWAEYTVYATVGDEYSYVDIWAGESEFFLDDVQIIFGEGGTTPSDNVFFETFGEKGPTSNPRAKIEEYDDYDNGLPVTFSYTTTDSPDVRAGSGISTHVWFPANKTTDLVIDNIPAAGYNDLQLSFEIATGANTAQLGNANLNKLILEVNNKAVTVPSGTFSTQNKYIKSGNIAIDAADAIKLRFYYTAANNPTNHGYRLDNVKITGTKFVGINPPSVENTNFSVSGNTLCVNNLANGSVVEIYNLIGAKVHTSVFTGNNIEVNSLAKGLYIVRAGQYSQKVIF